MHQWQIQHLKSAPAPDLSPTFTSTCGWTYVSCLLAGSCPQATARCFTVASGFPSGPLKLFPQPTLTASVLWQEGVPSRLLISLSEGSGTPYLCRLWLALGPEPTSVDLPLARERWPPVVRTSGSHCTDCMMRKWRPGQFAHIIVSIGHD